MRQSRDCWLLCGWFVAFGGILLFKQFPPLASLGRDDTKRAASFFLYAGVLGGMIYFQGERESEKVPDTFNLPSCSKCERQLPKS